MPTQTKIYPLGTMVANAALSGAIIGGTAATAQSIRKVKKGIMTREEAVKTVAREAGTASMATGAAAAVVGGIGLGGVLGLVGMALVATTTKYMLDQKFAPEPVVCEVPVEVKDEKPAAKKPAAKKAPAKKAAAKKTTAKKTATSKTTAKKAADKADDADK